VHSVSPLFAITDDNKKWFPFRELSASKKYSARSTLDMATVRQIKKDMQARERILVETDNVAFPCKVATCGVLSG